MCGIAGYLSVDGASVPRDPIEPMVTSLRHRGPDGFGIYFDDLCVLGHARLSVIDIEGGWQPIFNEDRRLAITFNGEIYNFVELRQDLESRGHRFSTNSDTEVVIHAYEEWGIEAPKRLNGQFALAIYDAVEKSLFLCRDRFGVRPLYYSFQGGTFIFGSEVKALIASGIVTPELRMDALDEIHTYWSNVFPNTPFRGVFELPPASTMSVSRRRVTIGRYWHLPDMENRPRRHEEYEEGVLHHLAASIRLRLRADVPVGAYLSGGLDSSLTAAMVRKYTNAPLRTFSLEFEDPRFDESEYQAEMARFLGTEHTSIRCGPSDIVNNFGNVIWAAEKPVLRTAPVPMYLLSRLVNREGYRVVLTGEGADEIFLGYDIFKEAKAREFCGRWPSSKLRPALLRKLYPYLFTDRRTASFQEAFFMRNAADTEDPFYGHRIRWGYGSRIRDYYTDDLAALVSSRESEWIKNLKPSFTSLPPLERTQLLEIETLLSGYLLSSQGDRVGMAHSVEARYPFLDHELVEYAQRLPVTTKMLGLGEKLILKKIGRRILPEKITRRKKFPFRAPDIQSFLDLPAGRRLLECELESRRLKKSGIFDGEKIGRLLAKVMKRKEVPVSMTDNLVLMAALAGQIFHAKFFVSDLRSGKYRRSDRVRIFVHGENACN